MVTASVPLSGEIPDEDQEIYQNLARLQKIHQQVLELRTLVPDKLVQSSQLILDKRSKTAPQIVASDIKEIAITGSKNIKSFQAEYESDQMKALWQKATSVELSQGDDVWTHDYTELANKPTPGASHINRLSTSSKHPGSEVAAKDDQATLDKFSTLQPDMKTVPVEEGRILPLNVNIDGLGFLVKFAGSDGSTKLNIAVSESKSVPLEVGQALTRISEEGNMQGLDQALSLIASYKGYKSQPCQKCGKVFDANLQLAIYRRLKEAGSPVDAMPVWISLHHGCVS